MNVQINLRNNKCIIFPLYFLIFLKFKGFTILFIFLLLYKIPHGLYRDMKEDLYLN